MGEWVRRCAYLAVGWSLSFAAAHFFWALGGTTGLAVSAGPQLAADRPTWFVALGLWGVGLACVMAAAVAFGTVRRLRVAILLGRAIGVLLLLRGIGVEVLLRIGSPDTTSAQTFWTHLLWNPWFIVGGTLFTIAAWGSGGRPWRA